MPDDLPSPLREELRGLENLSDQTLWRVAQRRLSPARQRAYNRLLLKNSRGTIATREKEILRAFGEEARRLTLKKAHAYMLLKWRGHDVSSTIISSA